MIVVSSGKGISTTSYLIKSEATVMYKRNGSNIWKVFQFPALRIRIGALVSYEKVKICICNSTFH